MLAHANNLNTNPLLSISTPPDIEAPNEARGRADKRSDAAIRWECGVRIPLAVPRKMYTAPDPSKGAPTARSNTEGNITLLS